MKKTKLTALLLAVMSFILILTACGGGGGEDTTVPSDTTLPVTDGEDTADTTEKEEIDVKLSYISELNKNAGALDDHAKEISFSSIEPNFRETNKYRATELEASKPFYPRIKKLADGTYIMFYNSGQTGPDILYRTSPDLENWSTPQYLAKHHSMSTGGDRNYATADAVVLKNGDILVCYSYRSSIWKNYTSDMTTSGLMTRRSTDNGKTWSEPEIVYVGFNWEPSLLEADNGEIYIMFTHGAAYIHEYGYNDTYRSSGSAIIRSKDGGYTWTPNVTGAPYCAQRVFQTLVGTYSGSYKNADGLKKMNNQMPVMEQLNNGTIMAVAETKQFDSSFRVTSGYFNDYFADELDMFESGPKDSQTCFVRGAGPYVRQFPSGETLLSYAYGSLNTRIGNVEGKQFGAAQQLYEAFATKTYWGSLEINDAHSVIVSFEDMRTDLDINMLVVSKAYLNHRINAPKATVKIDGDNSEWKDNTDALFLGSQSQAQATFRFAHDENKVYVLVERPDEYLSADDDVILFIDKEGANKYVKITVGADGKTSSMIYNGKSYDKLDSGIETAHTILGTVGDDKDKDEGFLYEIAIDKSLLGDDPSALRFYGNLRNTDKKNKSENNTFAGADMEKSLTWQRIILD